MILVLVGLMAVVVGFWAGWMFRARYPLAHRRPSPQASPMGHKIALLYDAYGRILHSRKSIQGDFPQSITRPQGRSSPRHYVLVKEHGGTGLYRETHG